MPGSRPVPVRVVPSALIRAKTVAEGSAGRMVARLDCEAMVFDLDGVLIDSRVVVERHWRRWAEEWGVPYARIVAVMHGRTSVEIIAIVARHLDGQHEGHEREELEGHGHGWAPGPPPSARSSTPPA